MAPPAQRFDHAWLTSPFYPWPPLGPPFSMVHSSSGQSERSGILFALLAYGSWGLFPLYWKQLNTVPALEILSHRMAWSLVLLLMLLGALGRWKTLRGLLRSRRSLAMLLASAAILACNWGIYIYGVNSDRVVETSLGYFINPLVTVLLGFLFLGERLGRWKQVAVAIAVVGVGGFILHSGQVPWLALFLALSFALYGLLRKVANVDPMAGLAVETMLLTPVAIAFLVYQHGNGVGSFGTSGWLTLLLAGCGVVTSMPLLWFNHAAKRLSLATLGFFQYVAPSLQFLLGVFLYREPFTQAYQIMFGFIWTALLMYSLSSWWERRANALP